MRLVIAVLAASLLLAPAPADARRSRHKNCLYGWNSRDKRCFTSADEAASARSGYKGFDDDEPTVKPSKKKKKAEGTSKKKAKQQGDDAADGE